MSVSLASLEILADLQHTLPFLPRFAQLSGKKILLTGATGFFGRWLLALIDLYNQNGLALQVTAVSRNPARFLQSEPRYASAAWLSWIASDICDLKTDLHFDGIIHAATDTSATAHADRLSIFRTILIGGENVLNIARATESCRILMVGSGAQYGPQPMATALLSEDSGTACRANDAGSAYGEGKRALETLSAIYSERYGLQAVYARGFAFTGAGLPLNTHFAIGNFIRDALWREQITLRAKGEVWRSYLHGADLAVWLLTLLFFGEAGAAYNIGSDQAITVADLARRVGILLAPGKPIVCLGEDNAGPRSRYVPDISRARALGLDTWLDLNQSIISTGTWARRWHSPLY